MKNFLYFLASVAVAVCVMVAIAPRAVKAQVYGPSLWTISGNVIKPVNSNWTVQVASSSSFTTLNVTGASTLATTTLTSLDGAMFPAALQGSDLGVQTGNAYTLSASTGGVANIGPGHSQNVSSPINITTNNKPMQINCAPGTAMTWNGSATATMVTLDANKVWQSSSLNGCKLIGLVGQELTSTTTGVEIGGDNVAAGTSITDSEISHFKIGVDFSSSTWGNVLSHVMLHDNGTNLKVSGTFDANENQVITDSLIFNQEATTTPCVNLAQGYPLITFRNVSFDSCAGSQGTGGIMTLLLGPYFENPNHDSYNYWTFPSTANNTSAIIGGSLTHDTTTTQAQLFVAKQPLTVLGFTAYKLPTASTTASYATQDSNGELAYVGLGNEGSAFNFIANGNVPAEVYNPLGYVANGVSYFAVKSTGLVGIGTSTPVATLQVQPAASTDSLVVTNSSGNTLVDVNQNNSTIIAASTVPTASTTDISASGTPLVILGVGGGGDSLGVNVAGLTIRRTDSSSQSGHILFEGSRAAGPGSSYWLMGTDISNVGGNTNGMAFGYGNPNVGAAQVRLFLDASANRVGIATTTGLNSTLTIQAAPASAVPILTMASTTGATYWKLDNKEHVSMSSSTKDTMVTLSSCGTAPSVRGTDNGGEVTVGSSVGTCTITFAHPWTTAPACTVTNQNLSTTNGMTYTISTTAISVTQTTLGGAKLDYNCLGINE